MMRRLLAIFILLSIVSGASYLLYKTNADFRTYVSGLIPSPNEGNSIDSLATSPSSDSIVHQKARKKIPKTLKPDEFYALDEYAKKTPKRYEATVSALAQYLIKPAKTDIEKARVLFTWVASHVEYDDKAFNSGDYTDYSAENVLRNKKAVCDGYGNILKALCDAAGLEAEKVIGYAKGYGYNVGDTFKETDHAWNVIKVDSEWRLFDATWANGYGTNKDGKLVSTTKFDAYWFDVAPESFIFTHLPEQSKWQLTADSLTLAQYEKLPYLDETFFKLGFNPNEVYNDAVSGKVKEFIETFSNDFPITGAQLPYSKNIIRGDEITFRIQSDYAEEIALIDDKTYHYFKKENNMFTLSHKPTGKQLWICVKINWFDKNFHTIVRYKVIDEGKIIATNVQ